MRANARYHAQIFVLGFVLIIVAGTALLSLPWVTTSRRATSIIDALFTAVSASSTTGLSVVQMFGHWNWWGELVVVLLVQIGGLGFSVGASVLLQMLRRGAGAYSLRDEMLLKDGAPALSLQEAVSLGGRIVRFTFAVEAIGALLLAVWFAVVARLQPLDAIWNGIVYAVLGFCHAGFDLTPVFPSGHIPAQDVWVNIILIATMEAGVISYVVFADVAKERSWRSLSLDAKLVLSMNAILLVAGAVVFLAAEWGGALAELAPESKVLASLFQSVSARTAGFSTINWDLVNPLTLFFWIGLMLIGGAAGSPAGGVGLSTAGVTVAAVVSTLRGNPDTQIGGRRVATPLVLRAVTVIVLFLLVYGIATVALSIAEHHMAGRETGMIDLMFESMSALSTTGVSTGITPLLTVAGKLVLCAVMFVGRLGPLTTVYALQRRHSPERYRFPEEAVRIG